MKKQYGIFAAVLALILLIGLFAGFHHGDASPSVTETASVPSASSRLEQESLIAASSKGNATAGTTRKKTSTTPYQSSTKNQRTTKYQNHNNSNQKNSRVQYGGTYTSKNDVALYLHLYGELPSNFITKKQAQQLGWNGGSLDPYAPGKSIGGDYFGNYEGRLPKKRGRTYRECDIDTQHKKSRGAKRIVYSNDGLIYYTGDHYDHFELLYGQEGAR